MNITQESDFTVFVATKELIVPRHPDDEVLLGEIAAIKPLTNEYREFMRTIISMHFKVSPYLGLDEDGQTWRFHPDWHEYEDGRSVYTHGSLKYADMHPSVDGIIIRPDRHSLITVGVSNPNADEYGVWWGVATFDPTQEVPQGPLEVQNIGLTPEEAWWKNHLVRYGHTQVQSPLEQ